MKTDGAISTYYPLVITRPDGSLVVQLKEDGTPLFGDGVTAENVWTEIARAIQRLPER